MVLFLSLLVLAIIHITAVHTFDWKNALPWTKDIQQKDYKKLVHLRLARKSWFPEGQQAPKGDEVLEQFPGSLSDAEYILQHLDDYHFDQALAVDSVAELLQGPYGYNKEHDSIFVMHTISSDAAHKFVKNIITALTLRNFMKKYNVFAFHMPGMLASMERTIARSLYARKGNFEGLSRTIGEFFDSAIKKGLMEPHKIHFVGFCYSSHLSGYIARYIASKNNNHKIKSITAMDPYSMFFSGYGATRLSRNDAQLVYIYHTNSLFFGTLHRKATADFNLNSGLMQPGCYLTMRTNCSHWRAVNVFWYLILYPKLWVARKCPSWILFKGCLCSWQDTVAVTFPPQLAVKGSYYLNTLAHKPYGYGPSGANCFAMNKRKKALELTDGKQSP